MILIEVGALGIVPKGMEKKLEELEIWDNPHNILIKIR